jgi:hypothetical protein
MDYLAAARHLYTQKVEPHFGMPTGYSEQEVRAFEEELGLPLPEAYRQYLLWIGKENPVYTGSDVHISDVLDNTEYLPELLRENGITCQLPSRYLVFFLHQGYIAAWFALPKASDDPLVYSYSEAEELREPIVNGVFSEYLLGDIRTFAEHAPRLADFWRQARVTHHPTGMTTYHFPTSGDDEEADQR